ncbi:MAG: hypothetical protein JSR71_06435 [Proteobacteria bacterium]|nr:hypothetical protein [Pseudomonadota bacterium]
MSNAYFIGESIIQTLLWDFGVVEVNEADKLNATIGAVFKGNLASNSVWTPHLIADD